MGLMDDVYEATHNLCDKCGQPVPVQHDMCAVIAATGVPGPEMIPALWYSRHFLLVLGPDGTVLCEGSPSRAQYIAGQPRDTRGYPYDARAEALYRAAWAKLQSTGGG